MGKWLSLQRLVGLPWRWHLGYADDAVSRLSAQVLFAARVRWLSARVIRHRDVAFDSP